MGRLEWTPEIKKNAYSTQKVSRPMEIRDGPIFWHFSGIFRYIDFEYFRESDLGASILGGCDESVFLRRELRPLSRPIHLARI